MSSLRSRIRRFHRPIGRYFRRKRLRTFQRVFGVNEGTRLLDVGGYAYYWDLLDRRPRVTILNLEAPVEGRGGFEWVIGDARRLPFRDGAFGVVFSNSLVEHILGDEGRQAFAGEVRRVGERFYVQTPNRWFPVEPHVMTPLIHFLPKRVQRRVVRNFTVWGLLGRPSQKEAVGFLGLTELLDRKELEGLFPRAKVWRERFLGLTKSWIAVSEGNDG